MSTPTNNPPSFRYPFENSVKKLPKEFRESHTNLWNAITDLYTGFDIHNTTINSIKTAAASAPSASGSSSSSSTTGVTAAQAASISQSTIASTFGKPNNQTGTSYTTVNSDYGGIITVNNASPVAVTLGGGGTGVGAQWLSFIDNLGAGTATLTPASGTINGTTDITLVTNQSAAVFFDGANWWAATSVPGSGGTITAVVAGTGLSGGGSSGSVTLSLTSPVTRALGGLNSTSAGTGLLRDGSTPAASEISGDATTSGSNALTLATVNSNVGSYTNANITVNGKGLITAAANGSSAGYIKGNVSIGPEEASGTYTATGAVVGALVGSAVIVGVSNSTEAALLSNLIAWVDSAGVVGIQITSNASFLLLSLPVVVFN